MRSSHLTIDEAGLRDLGVDLVILFGSAVRGQSTKGSDVDLGVLFKPGAHQDAEQLEDVRLALGGGDHLDLVCLNTADPLLLRFVAEEGVPQFEAYEGAVEEFRLRAHKRYMDTAKFRKLEAQALQTRHR